MNIEEFNIVLQKMLAYLSDEGVHSVSRANIYLTPLKPSGDERTLAAKKLDDFEIIADQPKSGSGRSRSYQRKR